MSRRRFLGVQVFATLVFLGTGWVSNAVAQVYQSGDEGAAVEDIQEALGLPVDGFYGVSTEQAVQRFQRRNDLICVDGLAGPETLEALGLGYLITNPLEPCGPESGFITQGRRNDLSSGCPTDSSGSYVAIVPGNTGRSPESLRSEVSRYTSASLRNSPWGEFIQAGIYDSYDCAEAQAAYLRAVGFDARAVYKPF